MTPSHDHHLNLRRPKTRKNLSEARKQCDTCVTMTLHFYQNNLSHLTTKPTKWLCTQRRLRSAWASAQSDQSSLCTQLVAKDPSFLHADSEDSDLSEDSPEPSLVAYVISTKMSWAGSFGSTFPYLHFYVPHWSWHRQRQRRTTRHQTDVEYYCT